MKKLPKCKQCGKCCKAEICKIGIYLFGKKQKICKALSKRKNKYVCSMVESEIKAFKKKHIFSKALGIGKGCCNYYQNGNVEI